MNKMWSVKIRQVQWTSNFIVHFNADQQNDKARQPIRAHDNRQSRFRYAKGNRTGQTDWRTDNSHQRLMPRSMGAVA